MSATARDELRHAVSLAARLIPGPCDWVHRAAVQAIRSLTPGALDAFNLVVGWEPRLDGPDLDAAALARLDRLADVALDELFRRQDRFVSAVLGVYAGAGRCRA